MGKKMHTGILRMCKITLKSDCGEDCLLVLVYIAHYYRVFVQVLTSEVILGSSEVSSQAKVY